MVYTIRNLISDAYSESGVVGIGMTMTSQQLFEGLSKLNLILDSVYATNEITATVILPVTFTGTDVYSIGPAPEGVGDIPDFIANPPPISINQIIIKDGNVRYTARNTDPISYTSRPLSQLTTSTPEYFYYERSQPLSRIRFYEGAPTGTGEIIYKSALVDVLTTTNFNVFSRAIKPYLICELASRLAGSNGFDNTALKVQSNNEWRSYLASTYEGQSYQADWSAPNVGTGNNKYNIFEGN